MNIPLVSVVILTWNRCDDILETVSEIKKSSYENIEIIVVDNGSTDKTTDVLKNRYSDVRLIALQDNIGIAGYNKGMEKALGEYIVLLDSDSFPARETIKKMVSYFEKDKKLGVAAFDVHNYSYRQDIDRVNITSCFQGDGLEATGYNGAGVGITKECLKSAGLLFEPLFLYMNEQEHALRIIQSGYKIRLFNDLIGFHKQSTVARSNEKAAYYYTRNLLWLVWRLYPPVLMIKMTIQIFFYASLYTFLKKTPVYWEAVTDAISGADQVFKNRSPVKQEIIKRAGIPVKLAFTVYR